MKPLRRIRILDLSHTLSGPFASRTLADLGADVVKVEPLIGDETRSWVPQEKGESIYFLSINRGLKSISMNLREDRAKRIVRKLVIRSYVVIEIYRQGVAEKLGVDYNSFRKINPKIVYCSIKGFQSDSSRSGRPAYDLIIQAMTGLMSSTGEEGTPPIRSSFALFDVITGLMASIYILACLEGNIRPAHIEIPMFESAIASMTYLPLTSLMTQKPAKRSGSAHPSIVPYQAFKDEKGRYFVGAAANEGLWRSLCNALNLDLVEDRRFRRNELRVQNRDELIAILQELFSTRPREHWLSLLGSAKVPAAAVYDVLEMFDDPYVRKSSLIAKVKHKTLGMIPQLIPCATINKKNFYSKIAPPVLGEYTGNTLKALGYKDSTIRSLIKDGIVS